MIGILLLAAVVGAVLLLFNHGRRMWQRARLWDDPPSVRRVTLESLAILAESGLYALIAHEIRGKPGDAVLLPVGWLLVAVGVSVATVLLVQSRRRGTLGGIVDAPRSA